MVKISYWARRSILQEDGLQDRVEVVEENITRAYDRTQKHLTDQIYKIFDRLADKNNYTPEELKKILNERMNPAELIELRDMANDIGDFRLKAEAERRLNVLAAKSRITRLEGLKAKSYLATKQLADVQLKESTDFLIDEIHESYKEATAEILTRKNNFAIKVWDGQDYSNRKIDIRVWDGQDYSKKSIEKLAGKHGFKELPLKDTKNILESKWHGKNYSERIWGDTEALAEKLEELFTMDSMAPLGRKAMVDEIVKTFDVSRFVARRLITTEANYVANQAKLKAWKDKGVEKYILVATLDLRTSLICGGTKTKPGKDGQIHEVAKAVVNGKYGNYPPFHPFCRTIAIAYFGEHQLEYSIQAVDPFTGERFEVKTGTKYWEFMEILKKTYSDEEIRKQKKEIIEATRYM